MSLTQGGAEMYTVYVAQDMMDAALLRQRLDQAGIHSGLKNDLLQGALGELPLTLRPEVFVYDEADIAPARQCVADLEAAMGSPVQGEVLCGKCGEQNPANFELCWKCGADLWGDESAFSMTEPE